MIKQVQGSQTQDVHIDDISERSGKFGPYLLWSFKDTSNNRWVGFTETVIRMGNRTWTWLYSLGIVSDENDSIDFDSLKGTVCKVYLSQKDSTVIMITETGKAKAPPKNAEDSADDLRTDAPESLFS